MPFNYYYNLTKAQQKIYLRSDEIHSIPLPDGQLFAATITNIETALKSEGCDATQVACQKLADQLTECLKIMRVQIQVHESRPSNQAGELHGLYTPDEENNSAGIEIWMRTAQRKQVVAFRTFLRTLLHELCHHFDYEYFKLPETFHTEGFYKRESNLFHRLVKPSAKPVKKSK